MEAVVFGNATLDVICKTVDAVPRHESISFEQVAVAPGGCGSNVALGLQALGVPTALVASIGGDDAAFLVERYWERAGLDIRYIRRNPARPTGVSVGLVDHEAQPRFVHTSGANALLTVDSLDLAAYKAEGARAFHVAGFFVLPGLLDGRLPGALQTAHELGLMTSLDVVRSPRMNTPDDLWPCLPHLDLFLCNAHEAWRLTGEAEPAQAARALRARGGQKVIVKLGAEGCWVDGDLGTGNGFRGQVPADRVEVVDTTGAGDAFAAGLIAAILRGETLQAACLAANQAGGRMVCVLGAVAGWFE